MTLEKTLRTILKYTLRFAESFLLFSFIYLTLVLYGEAFTVGKLRTEGEYQIYVQSNGIHTDVCLPIHSKVIHWDAFIPQADYKLSNSEDYVAIGWGDKGFFMDTPTWAELKFSTAFNAAFLPSSTAMHVTYMDEPQEDIFHKKVYLNEAEYKKLVAFVMKSFLLKEDHVDIIPNRGYSEVDNFYEANNSYHLFRTCNIWTNDALKAANVKTGVFALMPGGVMQNLKY